ncbi:MAG: hypothetical protein WAZ77_01215 [Candidatus Nitrosopolaris sp.]
MLKSLREHFDYDPDVRMAEHDLNNPLSQLRADLGYFDAVVSSLQHINYLMSANARYIKRYIIYSIQPVYFVTLNM